MSADQIEVMSWMAVIVCLVGLLAFVIPELINEILARYLLRIGPSELVVKSLRNHGQDPALAVKVDEIVSRRSRLS